MGFLVQRCLKLPDKNTIIISPEKWVSDARSAWKYRGDNRPFFAEEPGVGQESVWDYPRPPVIQPVEFEISVFFDEKVIAKTKKGVRVIETASAPTYYISPDDLMVEVEPSGYESFCEWKGVGESLDVLGQPNAGWRYVRVYEEFSPIFNWVSFYPSKVDCFIGEEKVSPQSGGFYGGWVTDMLSGPIKGVANSGGW